MSVGDKLTEIHRKELEVLVLLEEMLEMVSYEVDAFLEQFLQVELVRQPQDRHTVGDVEVPHHELDTPRVQIFGLQVVGGLQ